MLNAPVELATGVVVIGNVALVCPKGTVTLDGTAAAGLALASAKTAPPGGAPPESVTVPAAETPPVTLEGTTASLVSAAAVTVSFADAVTPL